MKNIGIIVDSSTILPESLVNHPNIHMAYCGITVEGQTYLDRKEFTHQQLLDALNQDLNMTSSMPPLGDIQRVYEEAKQRQYDHVFTLSISSHLSGTYSGFSMIHDEMDIPNSTLIDTKTIGPAVGYMVEVLLEKAQQDESLDEMLLSIDEIIHGTIAYILPLNLSRLVKSGRVNKAVGTLTNLLKLNILLVLKNMATQIEKGEITRTQSKALQNIVEAFKEFGVNSAQWRIVILENDGLSPVDKMKEKINQTFENIELFVQELPSVLALHGGLGVIAVQAIKKISV